MAVGEQVTIMAVGKQVTIMAGGKTGSHNGSGEKQVAIMAVGENR